MSVMDSAATTNEVTATPEVAWSEAHLESSMAQLQEMHARVRKLYLQTQPDDD